MPISQPYNINIDKAYEGMVYGLRTAMSIRTVEATDLLAKFGGAVEAKADTVRGIQAPAAAVVADSACYGILVRQINHEAATRPSNGDMAVRVGDVLGMLVEGEIMVKLKSAVARDAAVGFDKDTGTWESGTAYSNVVALQAGAAGDVIPVRIYSVAKAAGAGRAAK